LDVNRLVPGRDYQLNLQHGKRFGEGGDAAADPLFSYVNEAIFREKPTFRAFMALFNNYVEMTGLTETVTQEERVEMRVFLHEIIKTPVMQYCHSYLLRLGKTHAATEEAFISVLYQIWFEMYSRKGGVLDSSGFEHVFIGEVKNHEVTGMHNWIRIYTEERRRALDYRGFIKPRTRHNGSPDDCQQLITIQFEWRGVLKKLASCMVGTSPEFEIALYTMVFLSQHEGKIPVEVGPYRANLTIYRWQDRRTQKQYVASAFPEEVS
jgi:poly(U)-specific endoribonuclease